MSAFATIIPFLRPIEPWLMDPAVSEIMRNPDGRVFVEIAGRKRELDARIPEDALRRVISIIAHRNGANISTERPWVETRLPDGSRVAGVWSPISQPGSMLTIRKFQWNRFSVEELVDVGTLNPELLDILRAAIECSSNILISGGTATGKTTMLNALAALIDPEERLVVIEETSELQLSAPDIVRLEARKEQPEMPAVTLRDLVRIALRHSPKRLFLGEVRGEEAFELLQVLNSGHDGSISTIHASSAELALERFASCVTQSGTNLPYRSILGMITSNLHYVLHLRRKGPLRYADELIAIKRFDGERIVTESIYKVT